MSSQRHSNTTADRQSSALVQQSSQDWLTQCHPAYLQKTLDKTCNEKYWTFSHFNKHRKSNSGQRGNHQRKMRIKKVE